MRELLKSVAPALRDRGFKGSGHHYRRCEGDFVFVITFQGDRLGESFDVNLGAQPMLIPGDGGQQPDPKKLVEADCIFRRRVGNRWPWIMSERKLENFKSVLDDSQRHFFWRFPGFRAALASRSFEELFREFPVIVTKARAALHFARACHAYGDPSKAATFAKLGLELSSPRADLLQRDLRALLHEIDAGAA